MTTTNRFLRALGFGAVLGFAAFMLSGNGLSWLLAVAIFYYEFIVRKDIEMARRGGKA